MQTLPAWCVDTVLQATVLLCLVLFAAWLLRRASAAARRLVWLCALALLPAVPLISLLPVPPAVRIPIALAPRPPEPAHVTSTVRQVVLPDAPVRAPHAVATPLSAPSTPARAALSWAALLWLSGAGFCLLRRRIAWRRLRNVLRESQAIRSGPLAASLAKALAEVGVQRPVRLLQATDDVCAPMTWGWRRPVLLLPARAGDWEAEAARAVLLHEVAHIRNGDWAVQTMAAWVRALYWFHPLVWCAAHRLRIECEQACDDAVLGAGVSAPDYASLLLSEAKYLRTAAPAAAVAMARSSGLEVRLRAILNGARRRSLSRPVRAGIALAACLALIPLTLLRTAASAPRDGDALMKQYTAAVAERQSVQREISQIENANVAGRQVLETVNKYIARHPDAREAVRGRAQFAEDMIARTRRLPGLKQREREVVAREQDAYRRIVGAISAVPPHAVAPADEAPAAKLMRLERQRLELENARRGLEGSMETLTEAIAARDAGRQPKDRQATVQQPRETLVRLLAGVQTRLRAIKEQQAQVEAEEHATKALLMSRNAPSDGAGAMAGSGIVLTLQDASLTMQARMPGYVYDGYQRTDGRVHDVDVWKVVNTLRAAGAGAVTINGERLTETSAIIAYRSKLLVNGHEMTMPLRIKAVGDPKALAAALDQPGGLLDPKVSSLAYLHMLTMERVAR